jgi:two-component system OmpR family response regulator
VRLLVLEDDPRLGVLLQQGLREEGYAVDLVADGVEALWMGTENDYSAMVLDWMTPGLSGAEVCRALRQRERWAPVLMLTARVRVDDRVTALDAGADDYLAKPFAFDELAARLRALIRRSAVARPAVLRVGDLEYDPATMRVSVSGAEITMTAKERQVLEVLLRRAGEVLTRAQILEQGWDFAADLSSNIVDQYIAYLRRKLAAEGSTVNIETVRGAGYRIVAGA